jgi:hypothetical protein
MKNFLLLVLVGPIRGPVRSFVRVQVEGQRRACGGCWGPYLRRPLVGHNKQLWTEPIYRPEAMRSLSALALSSPDAIGLLREGLHRGVWNIAPSPHELEWEVAGVLGDGSVCAVSTF